MRTRLLLALALLASGTPAHAHVGSPEVVHEALAGDYRLLVAVRPPEVVPGVAEVSILSSDAALTQVALVPLPLAGDGARLAPTPDVATPVPGAVGSWVGRLWLMTAGAWQVRIIASGAHGEGVLSVPVPALPQRTRGMQPGLGLGLTALLLLLAFGAAGIAAASVREAQLAAGAPPDRPRRRRARLVWAATLLVVGLGVWGGRAWWRSEARAYEAYVYKPVEMRATVEGDRLLLQLADPGWLRSRRLDDLVPDHDHLMHLFAVRVPALDRVYHLHPEETEPGRFAQPLPALPAGRYRLYADVVHATGLAETAVAELTVPADAPGAPLGPDDAGAQAPAAIDLQRRAAPLAGGQLVYLPGREPLRAGQVTRLRFRIEDDDAPRSSHTLELYMGMLGHAGVLAHDGSVFAHLHPSGSVPMASLAVAAGDADPHAQHRQHGAPTGKLANEVAFPYSFPKPGDYRVFVQIKRDGKIETGAYDLRVD